MGGGGGGGNGAGVSGFFLLWIQIYRTGWRWGAGDRVSKLFLQRTQIRKKENKKKKQHFFRGGGGGGGGGGGWDGAGVSGFFLLWIQIYRRGWRLGGGDRVSNFFLQRTQIRKKKEKKKLFFFFFFGGGGGGGGVGGARVSDFFLQRIQIKKKLVGGGGKGG